MSLRDRIWSWLIRGRDFGDIESVANEVNQLSSNLRSLESEVEENLNSIGDNVESIQGAVDSARNRINEVTVGQPAFAANDIKIYVRDEDVTSKFTTLAGILRNGMLHITAKSPSDLPSSGQDILIIPQIFQDEFGFGGMGQHVAGSGMIQNAQGSDQYEVIPYWVRLEDGRMAIVMDWKDGSKYRRVVVDGPFEMVYGFEILRLSVPIP